MSFNFVAAITIFTKVLIAITKSYKQPECSSTEEWITKMYYMYTKEYYPVIEKNEIMPFTSGWMDLKIVILSEASQTEKDKCHMTSFICRI